MGHCESFFFSDKIHASHKITLINDNSVASDSIEIAEIFNGYCNTAAISLDIEKKIDLLKDTTAISDPITKAIIKYENHPSIIKINEAHTITDKFKFSVVSCDDIQKIVNALDISKATAFNSIPTKLFKQKCWHILWCI